MRHKLKQRKLNVTSSHRKRLLQSLSNALILHERIRVTVPRAKELRKVVEPLITLGRQSTLANKRLAFARLRNRLSVVRLFDELGPRFVGRPGGYTRIMKCGYRNGDSAPMAYIEFVENKAITHTEKAPDPQDNQDDTSVATEASSSAQAS